MKFINVGFIQTATFTQQNAQLRVGGQGNAIPVGQYYPDANGRPAAMRGTTALDIVTSPMSASPWYNSSAVAASGVPPDLRPTGASGPLIAAVPGRITEDDAQGGTAAQAAPNLLEDYDSPFYYLPPWVNFSTNGGLGFVRSVLTQVDFQWNFTTYLAVKTTETLPIPPAKR